MPSWKTPDRGGAVAGQRPPRSALQQAVGLLSRREHSQKELTRKLRERGVESAEIDAALERLADTGLQDQQRFADSLVRQRIAAGYGPHYLRAQLATHGLDEATIAAAIAAADPDWPELARELITRRFPDGLDDPGDRRRAAALLQRRGFDGDCLRRALG